MKLYRVAKRKRAEDKLLGTGGGVYEVDGQFFISFIGADTAYGKRSITHRLAMDGECVARLRDNLNDLLAEVA